MMLKRSQKAILWIVTLALSFVFVAWGVTDLNATNGPGDQGTGIFLGFIVPILLLGGMAFLHASVGKSASKS